jgi:hypothetical protein
MGEFAADRVELIGGWIEIGREDEARALYGDAEVDQWFRQVWGVDPDSMREEAGDD